MSEPGETCQAHLALHMTSFSIYCVMETTQIALCIVAIYQIMQMHKKKYFSTTLLIAQWIFYLSSIAFSVARLLDSISFCWVIELHAFTYAVLGLSYSIHWFALLMILYGRLRLVFDETVFNMRIS